MSKKKEKEIEKEIVLEEGAKLEPVNIKEETLQPETVSISKEEWDKVQKQLKMLYEVADKGRVANYESKTVAKKLMKVKLSVHDGGLIIGWQTKRDEIIRHPVTGLPMGENQEIEVKILMPDGNILKKTFSSYVAFSNAHYDERVEANVIGKSEGYDGTVLWTLELPDGRKLEISPAFVN